MKSVPDLSAIPSLSFVASEAEEMFHSIFHDLCASILDFKRLLHVLDLAFEASQIGLPDRSGSGLIKVVVEQRCVNAGSESVVKVASTIGGQEAKELVNAGVGRDSWS